MERQDPCAGSYDLRVKHRCCLMSSTCQAYMRWEPDSHAKAQ